jgi:hypothetical protein
MRSIVEDRLIDTFSAIQAAAAENVFIGSERSFIDHDPAASVALHVSLH